MIIGIWVALVLAIGLAAAFAYTDMAGLVGEDDGVGLAGEDDRIRGRERMYRDPKGNTCKAEDAHFGDRWVHSGLDANKVWCPASVSADPPPPPRQLTFALVLTPQGDVPLPIMTVEMTQVARRTVELRVVNLDGRPLFPEDNPRIEILGANCDVVGLNERVDWGPIVYHVGRLTGRVTLLRMRGVTLTQIENRAGAIVYVDDSGFLTTGCADL